jgi:hypothetical protein
MRICAKLRNPAAICWLLAWPCNQGSHCESQRAPAQPPGIAVIHSRIKATPSA